MNIFEKYNKLNFKKRMMLFTGVMFLLTLYINNYYTNSISIKNVDQSVVKSMMGEHYYNNWPKLNSIIDLTDAESKSIDELINSMSLEQKIGQMLLVPIDYDSGVKLMRFNIGNVYFEGSEIGNSGLRTNRLLDKTDQLWLDFKDDLHKKGLPFIPPFICMDSTNGNHADSSAVMFPSFNALGATHDLDLTRKFGKATTDQFIAVGINCRSEMLGLDVSEHPLDRVKQFQSFYNGSQYNNNILDVISGLSIDIQEYEVDKNQEYSPIISALNEGALAIKLDLEGFDKKQLSFIDTLRDKMNYQGIISTDINAIEDINGCWLGSCEKIFNSGVDIIAISPPRDHDKIEMFIQNAIESINKGEISHEVIDSAVRRILKVKMHLGMFKEVSPFENSEENFDIDRMVEEHEQLASQIVQRSAVLIKNEQSILPMDRNGKYLVVGNAFDDYDFQLSARNNRNATKFSKLFNEYSPSTTSIKPMFLNEYAVVNSMMNQHYNSDLKVNRELRLSPIKMNLVIDEKEQKKIDKKNELNGSDDKYQFSNKEFDEYLIKYREKIIEYVSGFDRLILIMNEPDFSQMQRGFFSDPEFQFNFLDVIQDVDIEIVIVYISSYPFYEPVAMNLSDSFVMLWQPGGELEAVMPLLFKDEDNEVDVDFSGKLSSTWLMHSCDSHSYVIDNSKKSRFPYKYGLSVFDSNSIWDDLYEIQNFCQYER